MSSDSSIGNEEPQDGAVSDAESNASRITIEEPSEHILQGARALRDRISMLGGKPTRPIAEYSRERVASYLWVMPSDPGNPYHKTHDEVYYRHYLGKERGHFCSELKAWESFLRWLRRKWVERNEAAGGSLPPLAPVLEMDPVFLHSEYLRYLLIISNELEEDEAAGREFLAWYWHFDTRQEFLEHVTSIASQVSALREERGLGHEPIFQDLPGPREQLRLVPEKLQTVIENTVIIRPGGNNEFAHLFQPGSASPPPGESSHHHNGRKRTREDANNVDPAVTSSTSGGNQDDNAPAAKRSKREVGKRAAKAGNSPETSPKKPRGRPVKPRRGKATAKPAPVEAEDPVLEPAPGSRKAEPEAAAAPKRRGRPSKKSQSASAPDTTTLRGVTPGQKQRGRPKREAPLPAQGRRGAKQRIEKKAAAARKTKQTTAEPPVTGLRRSARIIAQK